MVDIGPGGKNRPYGGGGGGGSRPPPGSSGGGSSPPASGGGGSSSSGGGGSSSSSGSNGSTQPASTSGTGQQAENQHTGSSNQQIEQQKVREWVAQEKAIEEYTKQKKKSEEKKQRRLPPPKPYKFHVPSLKSAADWIRNQMFFLIGDLSEWPFNSQIVSGMKYDIEVVPNSSDPALLKEPYFVVSARDVSGNLKAVAATLPTTNVLSGSIPLTTLRSYSITYSLSLVSPPDNFNEEIPLSTDAISTAVEAHDPGLSATAKLPIIQAIQSYIIAFEKPLDYTKYTANVGIYEYTGDMNTGIVPLKTVRFWSNVSFSTQYVGPTPAPIDTSNIACYLNLSFIPPWLLAQFQQSKKWLVAVTVNPHEAVFHLGIETAQWIGTASKNTIITVATPGDKTS